MTGIIDNHPEESARKKWCELLHTAWMYHQQKVKDKESPVLGAEISDDQLFHMGCAVAIQDAIALIQQMESYGYFEQAEEEGDLPQYKRGPLG